MVDPKDTLWRRLWVKHYGYRRFAGFRLPGGITVLSFEGNMPGFSLMARHPKWSVTWLWFARISFGRDRMQAPWWKRFALHVGPSVCKQASLHLGWVHFWFHWQESMAKRPGHHGYDRRQWLRYCQRIARKRAAWIAGEAYRAELARMMEPSPEEERV